MKDTDIDIGTLVSGGPLEVSPPKVFYDSPELYPHAGRPTLVHFLKERHGLDLTAPPPPAGRLGLASGLFARSCLVAGAPGGGKTRLALLLVRELVRRGYSCIQLDPQERSIRMGIAVAKEAGLKNDQIRVLWPTARGTLNLNPFDVDTEEVVAAANAFTDLIRDSCYSWGIRLDDILRCGAVVIAAQRGTVRDLADLLRNPNVRTKILAKAKETGAWARFPEQHTFFEQEFRGERTEIAPVLNKIRNLLTVEFLEACLCTKENSLNFADLLREQSYLGIHLDGSLGDDGVRLLSGLITHSLYRCVMRETGPHPILLFADEMGLQGEFTGQAVTQALHGCRQRNLHILACCQNFSQLSPSLRTALLSTAVRAFFRLEASDAAVAAASLTPGSEPLVERVSLSATNEQETVACRIVDGRGRELKVAQRCWKQVTSHGQDSLLTLKLYAALSGTGRLYAVSPLGGKVGLTRFLKGLSPGSYSFAGPAPLRLLVHFPRPRVSKLASKTPAQRSADLARALQSLPTRHAIVRTDIGDGYLVKVNPIEFGDLPDPAEFLSAGTQESRPYTPQKCDIDPSALPETVHDEEEIDDTGNL